MQVCMRVLLVLDAKYGMQSTGRLSLTPVQLLHKDSSLQSSIT